MARGQRGGAGTAAAHGPPGKGHRGLPASLHEPASARMAAAMHSCPRQRGPVHSLCWTPTASPTPVDRGQCRREQPVSHPAVAGRQRPNALPVPRSIPAPPDAVCTFVVVLWQDLGLAHLCLPTHGCRTHWALTRTSSPTSKPVQGEVRACVLHMERAVPLHHKVVSTRLPRAHYPY